MARPKGSPKYGGRAKGTPNRQTAALKDAILEAAALAGGQAGLVGYLYTQSIANPGPFMSLLGKVLPMQLAGDGSNGSGALVVTWGGPAPKGSNADD